MTKIPVPEIVLDCLFHSCNKNDESQREDGSDGKEGRESRDELNDDYRQKVNIPNFGELLPEQFWNEAKDRVFRSADVVAGIALLLIKLVIIQCDDVLLYMERVI